MMKGSWGDEGSEVGEKKHAAIIDIGNEFEFVWMRERAERRFG